MGVINDDVGFCLGFTVYQGEFKQAGALGKFLEMRSHMNRKDMSYSLNS